MQALSLRQERLAVMLLVSIPALLLAACDSSWFGDPPAVATGTEAPVVKLSSQVPAPLADRSIKEDRVSSCAIDVVGGIEAQGAVDLVQGGKYRILGWFGDEKNKSVDPSFILELRAGPKRYFATINHRVKRPDVATAYNLPAFENAGYDTIVDLDGVGADKYRLSFYQISSGSVVACESERVQFRIK